MVDLVKKTLIAGIIIQSSRFLMAAAVDVSTVATYSVGGLPISVMGDIQNTGWNVPILREEISSEPNGEIIRIKSTEDSRKISPCYTFNFLGEGENKDKSETLILARKYIYYQNGQGVWTGTKEKICHYHEDIYRFYSEDNSLLPTNATTEEDKQKGYNNNLLTLTSINITEAKDKITKGIFLQLRNDPFSQLFESDGTGKRVFLENGNLIPTP
ncbi:MAG: hypothetical protein LBP53_02120 [Candidatus Peribacteria bacterium]|jgi:hypothetical protein|nr:hypothetical protein [Candidatus Peribacteria bacterium]